MYSSTHKKHFTTEVPNHSESPNQNTPSLQTKSLSVTMSSRNENVPVVVYYDAYVTDCEEGIEFKGGNNVLVSMRRGMTFNALKTKSNVRWA